MAVVDKIEIKLGVTIPISTVERCLKILEMYLDDNPDILIECERKELFDTDEGFIKNELRIIRR